MNDDAPRATGKPAAGICDLTPATRFFHRASDRYTSHRALAARLHITGSHLSRLLKGTAGPGPELALRLADLLGQDRAEVLRACGHARLSEALYPPGQDTTIGVRLQNAIDSLPGLDRRFVQELVERLSALQAAEAVRTPQRGDQAEALEGGVR